MSTLQQAITDYLKSTKRLTPRTRKGYAQRLLVFASWCKEQGLVELGSIKASGVDDFVEHLRDQHTSSYHHKKMISTYTMAGYVRCIRVFLHWCQEDETYSQYLTDSVIRKIKLPKREQFVIETFSDAQLEALCKASDQEYNEHLRLRAKCVLGLLLCTGIRASELCTLKIKDAHLEGNAPYILVHGKGNKWRECLLIDLSQTGKPQIDRQTQELLQQYKARYRAKASPTATFFVGRIEGESFGTEGLEKMMDRLCQWSGITGVRCSPHTFRHTFAARFMQVISDIYLLSKTLGHGDVKTTEQYLKSISGLEVRLALLRRVNG